MPKKQKELREKIVFLIVIFIFLATFGIRVYLSLINPEFSDDSSYFILRQAEHIKEHGIPLYEDELSYGGRKYYFPPLYHYLMAFCGFFGDIKVIGTIITQLLISSTVIIIYLISKEVSKYEVANIIAVLMAAIVPATITLTLNKLSTNALAIPLLFFCIYCLMRINEKRFMYYYLISLILLVFTNLLVFVFMFGLLFYIILIKIETLKLSKVELEVMIFSFLFVLWFEFIILKQAFLLHGWKIIFQNIPSQILYIYYKDIDIIAIVNGIGILPTFYGTWSIYKYLFEEKHRGLYIVIGFIIAIVLALWLKLINIYLGFAILGLALSAMFAGAHTLYLTFLTKTKFYKYRGFYQMWIVIILLVTSGFIAYGYTKNEMSKEQTAEMIQSLEWIKNNTPENSTVLGTIYEGHMITEVAKRRNVIDNNYLGIKDIDLRLDEISTVYITAYETPIIMMADKYNFQYIFFSKNAKKFYGKRFIEAYNPGSQCIHLVFYNAEAKIYYINCTLKGDKFK